MGCWCPALRCPPLPPLQACPGIQRKDLKFNWEFSVLRRRPGAQGWVPAPLGSATQACSALPTPPLDLLEARRPLAHECLGEALRVMHQVISKYPLLNTVEILTAAGTLIAKVKG